MHNISIIMPNGTDSFVKVAHVSVIPSDGLFITQGMVDEVLEYLNPNGLVVTKRPKAYTAPPGFMVYRQDNSSSSAFYEEVQRTGEQFRKLFREKYHVGKRIGFAITTGICESVGYSPFQEPEEPFKTPEIRHLEDYDVPEVRIERIKPKGLIPDILITANGRTHHTRPFSTRDWQKEHDFGLNIEEMNELVARGELNSNALRPDERWWH